MNQTLIRSHHELDVYKLAFEEAMRIFEISKGFPAEERFALTDQIRRSSRSVCASISEAWRKRRYEAAFIHNLTASEAEAAETQTWIQFALRCGYLDKSVGVRMCATYDNVIGKLVRMINNPKPWILKK